MNNDSIIDPRDGYLYYMLKTLRRQMELLAERSEKASDCAEICEISAAMLAVAKASSVIVNAF